MTLAQREEQFGGAVGAGGGADFVLSLRSALLAAQAGIHFSVFTARLVSLRSMGRGWIVLFPKRHKAMSKDVTSD